MYFPPLLGLFPGTGLLLIQQEHKSSRTPKQDTDGKKQGLSNARHA